MDTADAAAPSETAPLSLLDMDAALPAVEPAVPAAEAPAYRTVSSTSNDELIAAMLAEEEAAQQRQRAAQAQAQQQPAAAPPPFGSPQPCGYPEHQQHHFQQAALPPPPPAQPSGPYGSYSGEAEMAVLAREQSSYLTAMPHQLHAASPLARSLSANLTQTHGVSFTRLVPRPVSVRPPPAAAEPTAAPRARLAQRLAVYARVARVVQGDGNCQFRALSDQLYR